MMNFFKENSLSRWGNLFFRRLRRATQNQVLNVMHPMHGSRQPKAFETVAQLTGVEDTSRHIRSLHKKLGKSRKNDTKIKTSHEPSHHERYELTTGFMTDTASAWKKKQGNVSREKALTVSCSFRDSQGQRQTSSAAQKREIS